MTGLTEGNIFQGELSLEQLFFNRPVPGWARYRTPIKDLWMCGSATHPGGGIMGAPGRIAALELLKSQRTGPKGRAGRLMARPTTRSSSARATTASSPPRTSRRPAARVLVLERRERVGGILDTDRDRRGVPGAGHRPHGGTAPPVGGHGPRARASTGWSRSSPPVRVFAPQPDGPAAHAVGRRRADGDRASRPLGRRRRRLPGVRQEDPRPRELPRRTCTRSRRRT